MEHLQHVGNNDQFRNLFLSNRSKGRDGLRGLCPIEKDGASQIIFPLAHQAAVHRVRDGLFMKCARKTEKPQAKKPAAFEMPLRRMVLFLHRFCFGPLVHAATALPIFLAILILTSHVIAVLIIVHRLCSQGFRFLAILV